MYELLNGPESGLTEAFDQARDRFIRLFVLTATAPRAASPTPITITGFPNAESIRAWQHEFPDRRLPVKMDIEARGKLPAGTRAFSFHFPDVLGEVIVTVDRPAREPETIPLRPGEDSPPFDLSAPGTEPSPDAGRSVGMLNLLWRYAALGFTHILPQGPDHALFVLGLFLLVPRVKTVLWQITAFTAAHTITLTLCSLHLVSMPGYLVEVAIAATIAFIGVENLLTTKVHAWRPVVAFIFGLVHGMGVATAFNDAGFPSGQLVPSLAAFTVGVEGGHLAILAAAFLTLGWWAGRPWYRHRIVIPLSLIIAAIGLFWMVQRLSG